jgi:hypothetical protein
MVYTIPLIIFSFFPPTTNPTPATMNWAIVMIGGPVVLSTGYYIIWGRTTYAPPPETIEDYMGRSMEEPESGMAAAHKITAEKSATPLEIADMGSGDEAEN